MFFLDNTASLLSGSARVDLPSYFMKIMDPFHWKIIKLSLRKIAIWVKYPTSFQTAPNIFDYCILLYIPSQRCPSEFQSQEVCCLDLQGGAPQVMFVGL